MQLRLVLGIYTGGMHWIKSGGRSSLAIIAESAPESMNIWMGLLPIFPGEGLKMIQTSKGCLQD